MGNLLKNIDKLVLNTLNGNTIEPSDKVWEKLEKGISGGGGANQVFKKTWPLILSLGFAVIAISTALLLSRPATDRAKPQSQNFSHSSAETINREEQIAEHNEVSNNKKPIPESNVKEEIIAGPTYPGQIEQNPVITRKRTIETKPNNDNHDEKAFRQEAYYLNSLNAGSIAGQPGLSFFEFSERYNESLSPLMPKGDPGYFRKNEFLIGAHFTPGITYHEKSDNRNNYSFEFTIDYKPSGFFIQSGLGLGYYTEHGNTRVSYSSYDSVGFFYDVQSFHIHPEYPDSIIFDLKIAGIYDSIDHIDIKQVTNKYLYLQVPFNIGFVLWEKNRFSLSARTGVIIAFTIYKDEPSPDFKASDIRIKKTERLYPGRLNTNIRWNIGLGFNYTVSEKLKFSIEPVFSKYFHPVYKNGSGYNTRMPYSIGLRTGFYINY